MLLLMLMASSTAVPTVLQGTGFNDILIHKFQLSSQRQWDVATVMPLR
jgi:hypothetical protein